MVPLKSGSETTLAYLALPATPAKGGPAIVLIHQSRGFSDWVNCIADPYAAQGYVAIAMDLYRGWPGTDGVGHAFLRDVGSPAGEEQAKLAWAEIDKFFAAQLKRGRTPAF